MNDGISLATVGLLLLAFLAAAAGAGWLGWKLGWQASQQSAATQLTAAQTERDLIREQLMSVSDEYRADRELASTLAPMAGALQQLQHQVTTLERDRVDQFARLDAQLTEVRSVGDALRTQTSALAGALRNSSARGTWGEVQLRRVVEHAGMMQRVDFDLQTTATTASGQQVRPDLVVYLPGQKYVIVDAKAPLAAFLDASEHPDDPIRQEQAAGQHAKALRAHVDALGTKEYWTAFSPSPELVVCFVPGEAFLASACNADPSLLEHAMAKRVVLATPTTMLALLRTVALTWQSDALSGSAAELFKLSQDLYRRLGTLGSHTSKLGRTLARAVEDYNGMVGSLENSVLVRARKLNELDLTDQTLDELAAIDATPRLLSAPELLQERDALPTERTGSSRQQSEQPHLY